MESGRVAHAQDPQEKFDLALRLAQDAFSEKAAQLVAENAKWKQLVASQREQLAEAERDASHGRRRIAELEAAVGQHKHEARIVLEQYEQLKRQLVALKSFKHSIVSMVEQDEPSETYAVLARQQPPLPHPAQPPPASASSSSLPGNSHAAVPPTSGFVVNGTGHGTGAGIGVSPFERRDFVHVSAAGSSNRAAATANGPPDAALHEAANELYAKIKLVVSPANFQRFAECIHALNAGQRTAAQTLHDVSGLLADAHLFRQLTELIFRAEEAQQLQQPLS